MKLFGSLFGWFKTDWIKEHLQLHDSEVKRAQLVTTRLDNHWNEINRLEDKLDSGVLALQKQIQCVSQNCEFPVGKQQKLNNKIKKLRSRCSRLEKRLDSPEQPIPAVPTDKIEVISSFVEEKLRKLTHNQDHYEGLLRNMQGELLDLKRSYRQEAPSTMFQSGKSQLASDTLEDEELEADGIKFEGEKGIEYVIHLIERRGEAKKLLEAQQRMINRLYKLAVTTVEDPGKSITEELRKAEKWKKTLRKKLKAFEEE